MLDKSDNIGKQALPTAAPPKDETALIEKRLGALPLRPTVLVAQSEESIKMIDQRSIDLKKAIKNLHLLISLAKQGIHRAVICSNGDGSLLAESIHADDRLELNFLDEQLPMGTARCIRDAASDETDALLLVFSATIVKGLVDESIIPEIPAVWNVKGIVEKSESPTLHDPTGLRNRARKSERRRCHINSLPKDKM